MRVRRSIGFFFKRKTGYEFGLCFFFFQAEDGIRDLTVTGVQTCALPISRPTLRGSKLALEVAVSVMKMPPSHPTQSLLASPSAKRSAWTSACTFDPIEVDVKLYSRLAPRSEERRVGKECRSRCTADRKRK